MAHRTKLTAARKARFLEAVAESGGNVSWASRTIKVSRTVLYLHRETNPAFKEAWDAAVELGIDALEDEAKRRAFKGCLKPVFQNGKRVGSIRIYSDMLMSLMLKAHRTKYKERHEITGPDGAPLTQGTVQFVIPDNGLGGQWLPGQPVPVVNPEDK